MNYDNTELLKFIELNLYDVDKTKTAIFIDPTSHEVLSIYYNSTKLV